MPGSTASPQPGWSASSGRGPRRTSGPNEALCPPAPGAVGIQGFGETEPQLPLRQALWDQYDSQIEELLHPERVQFGGLEVEA